MKFGKTYLESLEHVPEEWRQQAIEYRKVRFFPLLLCASAG